MCTYEYTLFRSDDLQNTSRLLAHKIEEFRLKEKPLANCIILIGRGMSGCAAATAISVSYKNPLVTVWTSIIRKEHDNSHGSSIVNVTALYKDQDRALIVFVDDFIATGDTYIVCRDTILNRFQLTFDLIAVYGHYDEFEEKQRIIGNTPLITVNYDELHNLED